jgi:hypothetical protein
VTWVARVCTFGEELALIKPALVKARKVMVIYDQF